MAFQDVLVAADGRGNILPQFWPRFPREQRAGVACAKRTHLPSSGSGQTVIVTGVAVVCAKLMEAQRRRGIRGERCRRKSGGERFFDGMSAHEGVQLLLAEGLGPDVASRHDERREKAEEVHRFLQTLLDEKQDLEMEDRMQLNRSVLWLEFLLRLDGLDVLPEQEAEKCESLDNVTIQTLTGRRACIPPKVWNELLSAEDSPFLEHGFLFGLEETGCVSLGRGWQPRFLFACRAGRSGLQLVGAVPMYLKIQSEGEFCEEADFIEASMKHNMSHYPRLFVGIPFTPHRGRRFITAAWLSAEERAEVQRELMQGVRAISVRANVGVNVGFPTEDEGQVLTQQGFIARTARQAWWSNRRPKPYKDFRDFLRTLRLKRAREIAKQRAALRDANVQTMVIDGSLDPDAVTPELMSEVFHSCYVPTQLKNGNVETSNGEYRFDLTEDFFCSLGERIPHRVLLILARENDGRLLGGSLCFVKDGCIYGRYWGSAETELDLPFLHFECCYYSAIEHAIAHGYERIEPGNGGGQVYKVQRRRGFEPVPTCSFHFIPDLALREEVAELARCAAEGPPDSWTVPRNSAYAPKPREYCNAV